MSEWTISDVQALEDRYLGDFGPLGYQGSLEGRLLDEVGPAIRTRGFATKQDLVDIARWKSQRAKNLIGSNEAADVEDTTRVAFAAPDRLRHRILTLLHGVQVPMASAILTIWRPESYTVIDYRAIRSLRTLGLWNNHDEWPPFVDYCEICRREADRIGVGLRTFDRALWQFDKTGTTEGDY